MSNLLKTLMLCGSSSSDDDEDMMFIIALEFQRRLTQLRNQQTEHVGSTSSRRHTHRGKVSNKKRKRDIVDTHQQQSSQEIIQSTSNSMSPSLSGDPHQTQPVTPADTEKNSTNI
ncbi:hypothetical protein CsSME_00047820 [Camellia sinensis var. sinensis]